MLLGTQTAAAALAALAGSLAGLGCSSSHAPARIDIARLIQSSEEFQAPRTVPLRRLATAECALALQTAENWRQFEQLGIIQVRPASVWKHGRRSTACEAVLTEEARRDISSADPTVVESFESAEETAAAIPVASRNFSRVIEVTSGELESADVQFAWQWQPNLLGRRLGVQPGLRTGRATLWLYESGWRLAKLSIPD